ncbi:UNVERIFIED_CONTAM: hypothetical protein PYX00_009664 [Menopon gallinae]|uniref:Phosphomevalonate kinase n=1 Tax=Menopon gallinae TaxID=328185 RepID=A0AAW2HCC3_9NEOP
MLIRKAYDNIQDIHKRLTMDNRKYPLRVLLFSGKRKSGKDYFTDKLLELCNADEVAVIKISLPIKSHFSKLYNLDLNDLMSSSQYKENFRSEMINWSDEMRKKDPGTKTDISWFKENYGDVVRTVRIEADENVRRERGWTFVAGVDDSISECDLDDYTYWDWTVQNNGDSGQFSTALSDIYQCIKRC